MGKEVTSLKSTLASIRHQSPLKGRYNEVPDSRVTENNKADTIKYTLGGFEVDVRDGYLDLRRKGSSIFRFGFTLDEQGNLVGIGDDGGERFGDKYFNYWMTEGSDDFLLSYEANPDNPTIFKLCNIRKKDVTPQNRGYTHAKDPEELKGYMDKVVKSGIPVEVNALDVLLTYSTGQIHQNGQNTNKYLTGGIIALNPFITAQSSI